jgi:hypothetical protein
LRAPREDTTKDPSARSSTNAMGARNQVDSRVTEHGLR